jgi:NADH dehydrogenase [ubiquinone] 1 alpha subcomplex assembly factor 7
LASVPGPGRDRAVSDTELRARLARHIRAHGPMSIAAFMAMAMHDRQAGYYASRQPIGAVGDFITAPEISQIFGELIGLWCADLWRRMGAPDPIIVAELGPGRGVLIEDFLRAAASVPGFRQALRIYLVETSPLLRDEQRRRLGDEATWVAGLDDIPRGPLLLVANEFLDALPIRQLVRGRNDWSERFVGLDPSGRLIYVDGPQHPVLTLLVPPDRHDAPLGTIVEICPAAAALAATLSERLGREPGAALFIDYGYDGGGAGATLAAIGGHQPAAVLENPGTADLSAHVDFAAFAAAARGAGAAVYGPVAQSEFLTALGAETRLATLSARATGPQRAALRSGLQRLIDPAEMGTLFKVLAVVSPDLPAPAGFG